jgi:ATP-binding cassette subfamily B protein
VESSTEKFGYVSATPMILNSTLRNNLNYGISKAVDDEKLEKLIKDFKLFNNSDISDLDKEISNKTLSTGQMQKVSFIRALAAGIDILILDESTSNLDTDTKRLIFSIIDKQKITIINSTHNPEDFVGIDNQITIKLSDERRLIEYKKL